MTALLKNLENNYLNIKNLKNNSKVSTFTKSGYLLCRSLCLKQSDKPRQYIVPSDTIGCLIKFLTHWYRFSTTMCENAFTWMRFLCLRHFVEHAITSDGLALLCPNTNKKWISLDKINQSLQFWDETFNFYQPEICDDEFSL